MTWANRRIATRLGRNFIAVTCTLAFVSQCATAVAELKAERLRCERLVDPLGIQTEHPRLDWIVTSSERGEHQTAYRILVASNPEQLEEGSADLWDSGRQETSNTLNIRYEGQPISPHQWVYWKVGVWDSQGNGPTWSSTAHWSRGIPRSDDWNASWVGCDELREVQRKPGNFAGAQWIDAAGDNLDPKTPRFFATTWKLPEDIRIASADFLIGVEDRCELYINGIQITPGSQTTRPIRRAVEHAIRGGENDIRMIVSNHQDERTGIIARLVVTDEQGKEHVLTSGKHWQSAAPADASWASADLPADKLAASEELGAAGAEPWGELESPDLQLPPPLHLRGTAHLDKPVRRAVVYVTALGICDLYLNGQRVSDEFFTPGWTDYTRRAYYRTYDVTDRVKQGDNAWGGMLADGWYAGFVSWGYQRNHYGHQPRLKAQLHVEYEDGSTADFGTDDTWRASTGPTKFADFLMGEYYDAREKINGWSTADFDASQWKSVDVGAEMTPAIEVHPSPPVRVMEEFRANSITEPRPGMYVIDLGQNFAGVPRLKLKGKPGQKIRLRFAERLNHDGTVYLANLRTARATDTYICKGDGVETWTPRFTFHGFQYIEVMGLEEPPTEDTVTGLALSSDTPRVGSFACSNDMLNQLYSNIFWTQRANFIDIPTDCPQRDERLGWTGDAQVYVATASLNADVQAFFDKWLIDLQDAQMENGQYPAVAPGKGAPGEGGPAWSDAGVICPWTVYQVYGDRDILARQYDSMKRFIEFCRERSVDETLPPESFHCFGDWLSINADTPKPVIYTAYYAQSTRLLSKIAEVLGKSDDAQEYEELYQRIRDAFNERFVADDGRIEGDTQCCYVLAIAFDLLDAELQEKAGEYLVEDILDRGGVLSTGFVGTKDLMLVLSKIGRQDVAYQLLETDKFPSWGFSIKHGATSIWERWDGWTPENGFQTPQMNSFSHYSFGAVYQWIAENVGGIRSNEPAYKTITVAPQPGGSLTWAKTSYDSIRGKIVSNWKKSEGKFELEVTIPANTTATVRIPRQDGQSVREGDQPVAEAAGVQAVNEVDGEVVVKVGSGTYRFTAE